MPKEQGPRQKRESVVGGGGLLAGICMDGGGIRRGSHKFSRGLLGTGVFVCVCVPWRTLMPFTVKHFPPLLPGDEVHIDFFKTQYHFRVQIYISAQFISDKFYFPATITMHITLGIVFLQY